MVTQLQNAIIEKDVENAWRQKILDIFPESKMSSPYNTDGYLETNDGKISLLLEFKFEENLKSKLSQVTVLSQTLYYLKKFEKNGQKLPQVVLIADKNECFILHSNPLSKYLDYELNWNVAASTAFKANPELIQDMLNDSDINPYVFDIGDNFNFKAIENKIVDLSNNVVRLIKITEHNINNVFEYFQTNVLGKNALSVNEVANLFINLIINPGENYLHPKRKNILTTKSFGDVYVNTDKYLAFFSHFDGEQYSIREKEKLTAIVDRIVEDETRRRKGEFFTPTIWVDEAHKMISEAFGENWKEEYVVWDPASGTLNLTRDYKFKELYCSTIEESDLKTAEQMKYNPEAVKFQYDFLNDGIKDGKIDIEADTKLPEGLKRALLEGKKMIVLMNPPYAAVGDHLSSSNIKVGISDTKISKIMKSQNLGNASKNLYLQFLFRTSVINISNICFFSPLSYLTIKSQEIFRKYFLNVFNFNSGYVINSNNFSDVSEWSLGFSIFNQKQSIDKNNFNFLVKKYNTLNQEMTNSTKVVYNLDGLRDEKSRIKKGYNKVKIESPQLTSSLKVKNVGHGIMFADSIGYYVNSGNNVGSNRTDVYLLSTSASRSKGFAFSKNKTIDITSNFTARKIIKSYWLNDNDEYMAPNESHPLWQQFQWDSIVYSLFNTSSNQSSLRQIDYKGKKWDIKNEFFWMSKEQMMKLAEDNFFDDVYRDARSSDERYVWTLLHKEGLYEKLSPDAKEVLDLATSLVKLSFPMRKALGDEHPEYHLNTWDAGWYQIKLILKQFYSEKLKEFTTKYKEFEDRMRPLVYELGFLKK
jgi:hypothetical protein